LADYDEGEEAEELLGKKVVWRGLGLERSGDCRICITTERMMD
jgi:hypothetical protein